MLADERRNIPRKKLERLAYIHIEPDNGGIVLNVSGDGLGFHSMNAVERNKPLRFSLQEQNRRIDVCGELVWTDEVQKIGGLRFTTLTAEARAQVRDWMSRPEMPLYDHRSTLGAAFLRAFPGLGTRRVAGAPGIRGYFSAAKAVLKIRAQSRLSGFSGGVITGLLVSIFVASVVYLSYSYRHRFGESLIYLGERLAQKPTSGLTSAINAPAPAVSTTQIAPLNIVSSLPVSNPQAPEVKPVPADHRPSRPQDDVHPLAATSHRLSASSPMTTKTAEKTILLSGPGPSAKSPDLRETAAAANGALRPQVLASKPQVIPAADSDLPAMAPPPSSFQPASSGTAASAPKREQVEVAHSQSLTADITSPLQMFFDLGKFKREASAQELSDRLAQLGLRTSVVPRGHLWMNSYQVLVGPYVDVQEEKKINTDLLSHGYKPRPLERGSRGIAFRSKLSVERTYLPLGDVDISWESYLTDAKVKFTREHDVVASASAKWARRPKKYSDDEYVYQNKPDGSRPLIEIHFAGLDRALVFSNIP